eukprot:6150228-Pyramimonas_sp.AAC.1
MLSSLNQAIYVAHEMEPNNKNVKKIIENGLHIQVWKATTPDDVLKWLKLEGNNWHHGVATTFLELFPGMGPGARPGRLVRRRRLALAAAACQLRRAATVTCGAREGRCGEAERRRRGE